MPDCFTYSRTVVQSAPSKERLVKTYDGENIRNVALVGHGDTGKTQLVSALLFTAGMVNRLGKVDEGTSVTDYDEEEILRKFSISASLAYAEWGKTKINFRSEEHTSELQSLRHLV